MTEYGFSNNFPDPHSIAVRPSTAVVEDDLRMGSADYLAAWAPGAGVSAYLHAFRRRWVAIVGLGFSCGLLLAMAVWFIWGNEYYASALLRVATSEKPLVFRTAEIEGSRFTPDAYDIYKLTQGELIKTPFVFNAALKDPNVDRLVTKYENENKISWLEEEIRVGFPGQAEIMEVGLRLNSAENAAEIVNAVVQAYLDEVVEKEKNLRRTRLTELEQAQKSVEEKVRRKRNDLKNFAQSQGTSDPETLTLKQRIAVQDWADHQRQLSQVRFAMQQAEGYLEGIKALLEYVDQREITKAELDQMLRNDPMSRAMYEEYAFRMLDKGYTDSVVRPGADLRSVKRMRSGVEFVEEQLGALQDQLGDQFRQMKRAELTEELRAKEVEVAALRAQHEALTAEVEAKREEAQSLGGSSVELEMMRADIENLDLVLANISEEIERVRVEINATPRVTMLQLAEPPEKPVNFIPRVGLTGLFFVLGICLPGGLILWWDTRKRLVNSSEDVSRLVGAPVMGTLPLVPRRLVDQLGGESKESQQWKSQLTESVDGIAARLLRQAALDNSRVVLITSAVSGEGKTSLATQLAMSLAHRGRKTVLVDGSLRRPAIGNIFNVPLVPGVSEYLRGEGQLVDLIRSTPTTNLSVVTAGRCDRRAVTALAGDAAARLFDELRGQYDFIIVDGSPILPLADTRFISQHVDIALLSVVRDLSQITKVSQARDVLESFGLENVETAVIDATEPGLPSATNSDESLPSPEVEAG